MSWLKRHFWHESTPELDAFTADLKARNKPTAEQQKKSIEDNMQAETKNATAEIIANWNRIVAEVRAGQVVTNSVIDAFAQKHAWSQRTVEAAARLKIAFDSAMNRKLGAMLNNDGV